MPSDRSPPSGFCSVAPPSSPDRTSLQRKVWPVAAARRALAHSARGHSERSEESLWQSHRRAPAIPRKSLPPGRRPRRSRSHCPYPGEHRGADAESADTLFTGDTRSIFAPIVAAKHTNNSQVKPVIPSAVAGRFFLVPFSGTPGHAVEESAVAFGDQRSANQRLAIPANGNPQPMSSRSNHLSPPD
jgi:hypothetical protein